MRITILLLTLVVMFSCTKTRVTQSSKSIEESKKIGVYIESYNSSKEMFAMNNIEFKIIESWVEYQWYYSNFFYQKKKEKNKSLYMKIKKIGDWNPNEIQFEVENSISHGFMTKGDYVNLSCSFTELPDTIKFVFFQDQEILLTR